MREGKEEEEEEGGERWREMEGQRSGRGKGRG